MQGGLFRMVTENLHDDTPQEQIRQLTPFYYKKALEGLRTILD